MSLIFTPSVQNIFCRKTIHSGIFAVRRRVRKRQRLALNIIRIQRKIPVHIFLSALFSDNREIFS
ncbi:MAG: hypothetical protein LBC02_05010 [Planctomycetaceae bacterium]|nr:hypothetical protein [Planctomycetaceae bacterium]